MIIIAFELQLKKKGENKAPWVYSFLLVLVLHDATDKGWTGLFSKIDHQDWRSNSFSNDPHVWEEGLMPLPLLLHHTSYCPVSLGSVHI